MTSNKLSDLFKGYTPQTAFTPFVNAFTMPFGPQATSTTPIAPAVPTTQVTRTLPVTGEKYQSPVIAQPTAPVVPKPTPVPAPTAPVGPAPVDYSKYTDPATGRVLSPQEYAEMLAKRVTGGSVPNYAGNALTQGPQTSRQLTSTATDLNNQRNDIAVGATDPYSAASKSGIAYSPTDLAAIEKAYAGIYDPAIKDVFAKLEAKQKEDDAALSLKNNLALQAQKHKDDIELKRAPTATEANSAAGNGPYVAGANPTVDAWAQRISSGAAKITEIPAADKNLRNAVTVALQSYGNQADGRPTTTEIGLQTLDAAKRLKEMFDQKKGISMVGQSRLFGGGIATPGSDSANFGNLFDTLIANRSLDGVKFLKGQGSVSDAERLLLKNAMSELNLSQSEGEFSKSLQRIIDKLEGNSPTGAPTGTGFTVTDPDGGIHTFPSQAAADEFKKAIGQ